jgi:hypothetical protein
LIRIQYREKRERERERENPPTLNSVPYLLFVM